MVCRFYSLCCVVMVCVGCAKEVLPPALPEERDWLLADQVAADIQPSGEERVPLSDVTIPATDLMRDGPSPAPRYRDLKQRELERQRQQRLQPLQARVQPAVERPGEVDVPLQRVRFQPETDLEALVTRPQQRPRRAVEDPIQVLRQANTASLVQPRSAWITGGIVRYPYAEGHTYLVVTSQDHPATILLPPGQRRSAPLMTDAKQISCIYPDPDIKPYRESIICMAMTPDAAATTPLMMRSGLKVWLQFRTVEHLSVRAITWSVSRETLDLLHAEVGDEGEAPTPAVALPHMPQIDYSRRHEDYRIEVTGGNPPWVPERVLDDGVRTFIKFKESLRFGNTPAVFTVYRDGTTGVVDWMAWEDPRNPDAPSWYVVPHIWPRLQLKGTDGMLVTLTRGPTQRVLTSPGPQARRQ